MGDSIVDIIEEDIEFLKVRLNDVVIKEGFKSKRVLALSQYIDNHIIEVLKIDLNNYKGA